MNTNKTEKKTIANSVSQCVRSEKIDATIDAKVSLILYHHAGGATSERQ